MSVQSSDVETRFELLRNGTVPTGDIRCCVCDGVGAGLEAIDHASNCPQRDVH